MTLEMIILILLIGEGGHIWGRERSGGKKEKLAGGMTVLSLFVSVGQTDKGNVLPDTTALPAVLTWWWGRDAAVGGSRLEVVHGVAAPSVPREAGGVVLPHILLQLLPHIVQVLDPFHVDLVLLPENTHTHTHHIRFCHTTIPATSNILIFSNTRPQLSYSYKDESEISLLLLKTIIDSMFGFVHNANNLNIKILSFYKERIL